MQDSKRIALGALAWAAMLAVGLGACGGSGGGGGAVGSGGTGADDPAAAAALAKAKATPTTTTTAAAPAAAPTAPATSPTSTTSPAPTAAAGTCELFPAQAIFNTRVDDPTRFPVHASSSAWVSSIGSTRAFHADWWKGVDPSQSTAYYGIPFNTVDGSAATTDWAVLNFDFAASGVSSVSGWPAESDCAVPGSSGYTLTRGCSTVASAQRRFPFPTTNLLNEGGTCNDPNTCGDHHVLVVEQGACRLWEAYSAYKLSGQWYALSTAAWDLKSLALRPQSWTSADAAGLPITPFLVKAAEADSGTIPHALRVTFRDAVLANTATWPARHGAGGATPGGIPFGALLRLRSDFVIPSSWTTQAKAIATAAKQYGMYVADIGSDFYVQGEPSAQWQDATFTQLATIPMSSMEFVDLRNVTGDARWSVDSMAGSW